MNRHVPGGFTLVELLVVVVLITVLMALLSPALDKALVAAERAECGARQHALLNVFNTYAMDQGRRKYPSGIREGGEEHSIYVSNKFVEIVVSYVGNNKSERAYSIGPTATTFTETSTRPPVLWTIWGVTPRVLIDPAYQDFGGQGHVGWIIGYQYLGGHPRITQANANVQWESPMSTSKAGSGHLVTCNNHWLPGTFSLAPHTDRGALGENSYVAPYYYFGPGTGQDIKYLGAEGGNVGHTDGSVVWKNVDAMDIYLASQFNSHRGRW